MTTNRALLPTISLIDQYLKMTSNYPCSRNSPDLSHDGVGTITLIVLMSDRLETGAADAGNCALGNGEWLNIG